MKKFQTFSNINGFDENCTEKNIELQKTVMAYLRSSKKKKKKNPPPVIPPVLVEPPLRILLQTEICSWAAQRSRRTVADEQIQMLLKMQYDEKYAELKEE